MKMEEINIGDVYYVPYESNSRCNREVLKGHVIEINRTHQTVLFKGILPYTDGNFGAHLRDIYKYEVDAYNAL